METIEESVDEDGQVRKFSKTSRHGAPGRRDVTEMSDSRGSTEYIFPLESRPEHTRTAMGDYIVPKGGKPLTQHAFPSPGPGDYSPSHQFTQRKFPQYSIVGRSKTDFKKQAPGPGDYNTSGDLIWRDKKVTLKGKGKTTEGAHDHTNTIGPAHNVCYLNTGKHAPKPSMSSRHRPGANVGHPSNALSGIVTNGFPTPGPNAYSPKITEKGKFKSFGVLHRHGRSIEVSKLIGPGPAAYNVKEPSTKSGYSLAKRLIRADWQVSTGSPAPNSYNVGSKIGKGLAMSIRSRQPYEHKNFGPSPNSYFLRDPMKNSDAPSAIMTYRPFETDIDFLTPAPTHYSITEKTLRKAPAYSFRGICKYPVTNPLPEDTPGPGTYLVFTDNDAPAHSMGKRIKPVSNSAIDGPGPNHYQIRVQHRPDGKRAPSFSMAARCDRPAKRIDVPAPNTYTPRLDKEPGPKYSMASRPKKKTKSGCPAPNSYAIKMNQTVKGRFSGPKATLKGRNTPFVYQGYALHNPARLRDA